MYLQKLNIKNFRSCNNVTLELNSGLNVLIGHNGSGKSSLLHSILMLKRLAINGGRYPHQESEIRSEMLLRGSIVADQKPVDFNIRLMIGASERSQDEIVAEKQTWHFKDKDASTSKDLKFNIPLEAFRYFSDARKMEFADPYGNSRYYVHSMLKHEVGNSEALIKRRDSLNEIHGFCGSINYYSASQFSDPSRCPASIEIEDERREIRRGGGVKDHGTLILHLYRASKGNPELFEKYLNLVNKKGLGLIENINFQEIDIPSNQYTVFSGGKVRVSEVKRKIIIPEVQISGKTLSLGQLSEGTFKTLALVFYVITDQSQMILIEEPEVSIHHGLLNGVVDIISKYSKNKQVVVTTHSDFLLDRVDPDVVQLVRRDDSNGTSVRSITKSMSSREYSALKKYLNECGNLGEYWREGGLDGE